MVQKFSTHRWKEWPAAMLLALLCTAGSYAEEPAPPVPPPPVDPNAIQPEKPVTTNALDVDYVFDDNGRRDPFSFTKNIAIVPNGESGAPPIEKGDEEVPQIAPEVVKRIKSAAEAACTMAETSLMELDPNAAITKCDSGMDEFKPITNLSAYPDLEIVKGRLLRARKAAEQMRSRQAAQRDFDALGIEISGVMALKKNSQAIINGEIVHKGALVKGGNDNADVMVDDILPERVTFVFRGYHMMLLLADAGRKK